MVTSGPHLTPHVHTLTERSWRLRLHAGTAPTTVVDAARRAVRAMLAAPGEVAVGFAILRPAQDGWTLLVNAWRGAELVREASLLLPGDGGPPRRSPVLARSIGAVDDVLLLAREAAAWVRHAGDADTYLAESVR